MTTWRPSSGPDTASRRAEIQQRLRAYFAATETLEVDTPALSAYAVSDPQIESIEVQSRLTHTPLYLHTSPEFCMKRLLAAGFPDIFSLCRVFRDGESGRHHQPEFTLVEWYRLGFDLDTIITDSINAISAALDRPHLAKNATILNYRDAYLEYAGIDPVAATMSDLAGAAGADLDLRESVGADRNDWLDLLMATRVAAAFSLNELTVIRHYPISQAALAQACPDDSSVADRFEIFIGPIELANGYVELTDAVEQRYRMKVDQENRKRRRRALRPTDALLLSALEAGLPACAGVAMGLERLQMVHDNTDDIRNVVTFAFEDRVEQR